MADNGSSMTITTYKHGLAEIVVYRPQMTADEEASRNSRIVAALAQYGREMFNNTKKKGDEEDGLQIQ